MQLNLHNTKSRSVEPFSPLHPPLVTTYACGPTVYDKTHIGHMRKYIGDDILRRTLTLLGYEVKHVMNVTDVGHLTGDEDETGEDKLEKGAKRESKSVWDVAQEYLDYFHMTMKGVNVLTPTIEPRATDHVEQMKDLIKTLYDKGFAYETEQAIYFDTSKDPEYGTLSGQKLTEKEIAARDDVVSDPEKRNPADFSLWFKTVGKFKDHAMRWKNPLDIPGEGFPGWHIECSAMSMQYLGEHIDIHTGGIDHIPVHHENEIAQSECATGHEFVRFWVHYNFLLVDGEKMSKSKNNFHTIEDMQTKGIDPVAIRILFMQTSYSKPLNFTWESLEVAAQLLKKLQQFARKQDTVGTVRQSYMDSFTAALCDDLNTAKALAVVWELLGDASLANEHKWATLLSFDSVLGLGLKGTEAVVVTDEAHNLVEERDTARNNKDYALSDTLRSKLEALGYEVLDTPEGTILQ
jgi:cysteinyl-tRNA synthetase